MNLFIEPGDVWLFRDGRPFSAGDDHRAASLFPPTPRTVQGVLRSKVLLESGASLGEFAKGSDRCRDAAAREVAERIGWPESTLLPFTLCGPLVARRASDGKLTRFFPHPQDLVRAEKKWATLTVGQSIRANWPDELALSPLWPPPGDPEKFSPCWLSEDDLLNYLEGKSLSDRPLTPSDCLYRREPRFSVHIAGIAKRPEEGHLFAVEFVRPLEHVGLLVGLEGLTVAPQGMMAMGGEARVSRYDEVATGFALPPRELTRKAGRTRFKLYIATPALFDGGWKPGWLSAASPRPTGTFNGVAVELVAAANGKPQGIGGFDVARGQQRPLRRAVPAGSAYFFETDHDPAAVIEAFDARCVSDSEADRRMGFGLAYVGTWTEGG